MPYHKLIIGDVREALQMIPNKSVSCCFTSPPYYSLRDYQTEPIIWGGKPECEHEWNRKRADKGHRTKIGQGTSCVKCGAWIGSLGHEPTPELFVSHLVDIFDIVMQKLRDDGSCWVNLGTTFANDKCDLMIPERFAVEMTKRGYIKRRTVIWHKKNCMPASHHDDFTLDFEYLYRFVKRTKTLYWTNSKTLQSVTRQPLGVNGVEGVDWEWKDCPVCNALKGETKIGVIDSEQMSGPRARYHRKCSNCCVGGKIKVSLWNGHDNYFEQQFEDYKTGSIERLSRGASSDNKWVLSADGRTPHNLSQQGQISRRCHQSEG